MACRFRLPCRKPHWSDVLSPKNKRNSRFALLCHRRNRMTLSPESLAIFRFGLAPAGPALGPVGRPRLPFARAASALEVRPRRALSSLATSSLTVFAPRITISTAWRLKASSYFFGTAFIDKVLSINWSPGCARNLCPSKLGNFGILSPMRRAS